MSCIGNCASELMQWAETGLPYVSLLQNVSRDSARGTSANRKERYSRCASNTDRDLMEAIDRTEDHMASSSLWEKEAGGYLFTHAEDGCRASIDQVFRTARR